MKVKKFMSTVLLLIVAFVTSLTFAFSAVQYKCVICDKVLVRTNLVLGMLDYKDYFGCQEIDGLKTRRDLAYVGYRLLCIENNDGPLCYSCASQIINEKAIARDTEYSITVPESVVLSKTTSDYSGTYTGTASITASGFIQLDQRVYFTASNPEMHRTGSTTVKGTATATTATDWESMDVSSGDAKTEYTVSANITPGDWTGTMTFYATVSEKYDITLGDNTNSLLTKNENIATIKFSSSAPEIATVDSTGCIQTISAGNTTITKMVYDSTGENLLYTSIYDITVSVKTADMVTTRLIEPLKTITAAGTKIDTIQFGQYTIPSGTTTYDVSGDGSNTIKAFVDGTALKVTNTKASPVTFAAGNSLSFNQDSAFADIKTVKYESVDTSKVTSANAVFKKLGVSEITGLDKWDTSNITDIGSMFSGCSSITNLDVASWDTSKVTNMSSVFSSCTKLADIDIASWDVSSVTSMSYMFSNCTSLTKLDINDWNASKVTTMSNMFYGVNMLSSLKISNLNTSSVTNMSNMFRSCRSLSELDLNNWNVSKVTDMSSMFYGCSQLASLNVSNWNTSRLRNMTEFLMYCSNLSSLDVSKWNTSSVTNISSAFNGCSSLTALDVSNWNVSKVTIMGSAFEDCSSISNLNISNWDVSSAKTMSSLFHGCSNLTSIDLNDWDVSNVTSMAYMFSYCTQLKSVNIKDWNVSNVTTMQQMFRDCTNLLSIDVSKWDTSALSVSSAMSWMFYKCTSLTQIQVGEKFATNKLPTAGSSSGMFYVTTTLPLTIYGTPSDALKAYAFTTDKRVVSYANGYAVTYIAENGKFSNGTNKNTVVYGEPVETSMTKVSKSGNVSDDGTTFYGYYEPNRETIDKVIIPGATQLTVTITYDTSSVSTDWVCIYDGSVTPTASNYSKSVSKKLGGHSTSLKTKTYTITGDTVQFYFKTGGYYYTDYYGYYATVEGTGYTQPITSGSYEVPSTTANNQAFTGWYGDSGFTVPFNKDDYIITGPTVVYGNVKSMNYVIDKTKLQKGLGSRFTTIVFCNKSDVPTGRAPYSYIQQDDSDEIALYQVTETKTVYVAPSYDLDGAPMYAPEDCSSMFHGYTTGMNQSLTEIQFKNFNTSKVTNMTYMFSNNTYLTTLDISGFDMSNVTTIKGLFQWDGSLEKLSAPNWNTSNLTDISYAFDNCQKIKSIDIKNWDTSKVTTMSYTFDNCLALTSINCDNWNTGSLLNMNHMFYQCCSLTSVPVSNWDTSKVEDMSYMFKSVGIYTDEVDLDVSNWNTSNVTDMSYLFCSIKRNSIDVSNWDTRNVTSMAWMFRATNCTTIKISNFDTSSVTDFSNMFDTCNNLTDLYVGKKFATANLPTISGKGMFNFDSNNYGKHINIHGQVSDALKTYDYSNDKIGTPNFVDSQSLFERVTVATPETAMKYDERPAA